MVDAPRPNRFARFTAALTAVGVVTALAGCGKNPPATKKVVPNPKTGTKTGTKKIVWYGLMVHPYFEQVKQGVEAFEKDTGVSVKKQIGQEATQNNESANVEALAAQGYRGFAIYPGDASAANGLYQELTGNGCVVVSFGAPTQTPSPASFCVATDVKAAAAQATEALIDFMGGKGRILNVLELVEDPNTQLRKQGIEETVAKHPGVTIAQTIAGMTSIEESTSKIQDALSAQIGQLDGVLCTGYTPTVAAATILSEWRHDPKHTQVHFVGIDTDEVVLKAIRAGDIDGTLAQNPYAHGYVSCKLVSLLLDGLKPRPSAYFVDTGTVLVTKENVDTYPQEVAAITRRILKDLRTKCFEPAA